MKIAILTNFMEFNAGYSLTGIVQDQIQMLRKYGHEVHLYVNEKYHGAAPVDASLGVIVHQTVPFTHLTDYTSIKDVTVEHGAVAQEFCKRLQKDYEETVFDVVYTHDFVFTGWFLPYGMACMKASELMPKVCWLHWIHSIPSTMRDWWDIRRYGPQARIVFPNRTDSIRVVEQYRTVPGRVVAIPHIKDIRTWGDYGEDSNQIINAVPELLSADVVQIFPASTDRLSSKRVDKVILIFAALKKMGFSVCLGIANQWATGRQRREDVTHYERIAMRNGLKVGQEFFFTSQIDDKFDTGIPKRCLRELFGLANLFIFPTREESFGLVVPEAALSSSLLMVLNKSLQMQIEISGMNALYIDFGSFHNKFEPADEGDYLKNVAALIVNNMRENSGVLTRSFMRTNYNMDTVYSRYYLPIMTGLVGGVKLL